MSEHVQDADDADDADDAQTFQILDAAFSSRRSTTGTGRGRHVVLLATGITAV